MPTPLLAEEDRKQVLDLFTEMKTRHTELAPKVELVVSKLQPMLDRLDSIEEKQRQHAQAARFPFEPAAGALAAELLNKKELINRPKSLGRNQGIQFTVQAKNIVSGVSRGVSVYGGVAPGPAPTLRLRTLIPQISVTGAGAVVFSRETAATNNAAPVAEMAAKPQSDLTYSNVTQAFEVIAHYIKISEQTYNDLPGLASAITTRMIDMLLLKEENQLLNGSGVAPQLTGFLTVAPVAAAPPAGSTLVDAIAIAAGTLAAAGYQPDGAVVNSADWIASMLVKDTLKQYVSVPPGLLPPVIVSPVMPAGKFLVGAFGSNSTLYVREDASVTVATMNEDDFVKNLYTILAELRETLAILQAAAFLQGTVPAAAI